MRSVLFLRIKILYWNVFKGRAGILFPSKIESPMLGGPGKAKEILLSQTFPTFYASFIVIGL